jgi:hypothetical protein
MAATTFIASIWVIIAALVNADVLTTITACPQASTLAVDVITITSQHQPIPTCVPKTHCSRKACETKLEWKEKIWVSTTIPCCWNGTTSSSTLVTNVHQAITVSKDVVTAATGGGASTPAAVWGGHPHITNPKPFLEERSFIVPYDRLGPGAIPGFAGSGLCDACEGEDRILQNVTVRLCPRPRRRGRCSSRAESWIFARSHSVPGPDQTPPPILPDLTSENTSRAEPQTASATPPAGPWQTTDPTVHPPGELQPEAQPFPTPEGSEIGVDQPRATSSSDSSRPAFDVPHPHWGNWPQSHPTVSTDGGPAEGPHSPHWGDWFPLPSPTTSLSTSSTSATPLATTPALPVERDLFRIQLRKSGTRFPKRAISYISFVNGDAYLTENLAEAALFRLLVPFLMHNRFYVGAASIQGVAAMEEFFTRRGNLAGWSRDGDTVKFSRDTGFCVTEGLNVIMELTQHPPFRCDDYDLIAENIDGKAAMLYKSLKADTF